ncbi:MAG: YciI family protein [Acidimicrobiales bacterium]
MKYALLLYTDHDEWDRIPEETQQQILQEYVALDEALKAKGMLAGGEGLEAVSTATTVRVRDGKRTVTDGPFAETKEALGGFYVIECESLDEAIDWAARIPDARAGSVEVRPVIDYEAMGMTSAGGAVAEDGA